VGIVEFTVAPFIASDKGQSFHEWFVEFESTPEELSSFALEVDNQMRKKNVYYDDLIAGNILRPLKVTPIQTHGFIHYMKSIGKLGGQNKVPRLSNDRKLADELTQFSL
jgi:hypothetical protein